MNLLFSTIGKRGYVADFFRPQLAPGDRIIGTGNTPWTPGFGACDTTFLMPDIGSDDYLPAVIDLCKRESIDGLLSFSDPDVHRLATIRDELLAMGMIPLIPDVRAADIAFDKYRTHRFLTDLGVATPRTAITIEQATDFTWPLFLKPRHGSGSHHNFTVTTADQLEVLFGMHDDMLIQELIVGEEVNVEVCADLDGEPVGLCQWRKYRSNLGETEQAETYHDQAVADLVLEVARALKVVGPMDVDVIRTDDAINILEFNPRFGGGYPVSHLAGADFPAKLVELVRHGRVAADLTWESGIVMMKQLQVIGGPRDDFLRDHGGRR